MAAGAGTRLRPLTVSVPKPMVPVANKPVLEYTLKNLQKHGITEVILNLHSHPQMIQDYFQDGRKWGLSLSYSYEPELLGTAGGVKNVESFLRGGTFLVMSGDGLTDADLTALIRFHKRKRSAATIALKAVDTRFDYGVTIRNPHGRIKQFIEKPLWSDVFSNEVNTGIYVFEPRILDLIPRDRVYDFGHELWPKLLKRGDPIYGFPLNSYWCDVGSLQEYRRAQQDVLDKRVHISFAGRQKRPGVWVDEGTVIEPGVTLEKPCLIGKNCHIRSGSHVEAYTMIGDRAQIGRDVHLKNCILWNDVRVENYVKLENCIIANNGRVKESLSVYEGAVFNFAS